MSIRARLLLIALIATLLPAMLVALRFLEERGSDVAEATQRLPVLATTLATALAEKIQGTQQLHFGLARASDLDTRDRAACSAFLSQVREKYPQYTGILTIEPDGQLFCDSLNTGRKLDVSDRGYFRRALVPGTEIAMQPAFGRLTGVAVLQIAYPVRTGPGDLRFVLLASLNLSKMPDKLVHEALMPDLEVLLLDPVGLVLASAGGRSGTATVGRSMADSTLLRFANAHPEGAVSEIEGSEPGNTYVWAVADSSLLKGAGVHVLVGHPKRPLLASASSRFTQDTLILFGTALVVFVGVGLLTERGIRRHIATIGNMVRRLGKGEHDARIAKPHPRGELGDLMELLNRSAEDQQRQRQSFDELDEKLRASQRLEAIGQLTGGVAHDFNNLLTVILGNGDLLSEYLKDDPRLAPLARMVVEAADRGADLTQRLLAFARKQALNPKVVDINKLVLAMDPLLRRSLGEQVEIVFRPGADLWAALVDPSQLDNALLNLCLNARDAMPGGGRIVIATSNIRLDQAYADRQVDVQPGEYVMLTVSDSGVGIAPEALSRVFEPFYTTKEKDKGTGLGLAMIFGFVKQSHGHVDIQSDVGIGTTVQLYLPRADTVVVPPPAPARPKVVGGAEAVLLVEDDELVRRFAQDQLLSLGYRVLCVSGGAAALDVIRTDETIDLLFTDVVMPGMNGRELVIEAHKLRPRLRVLYASGYSQDTIVHDGRLDAGVQLLSKPYRREELAQRVRAVLDSPA